MPSKIVFDFLEILKAGGINVVLFIAGFVGGLSSVDRKNNLTWLQKATSLLSGGFSANYLTPLIGDWLNLKESSLYGVAFLVGYGGLKFIELAYRKMAKLTPNTDNNESD